MHEQDRTAISSSGLVTRAGRAFLGLGVALLAVVGVAGRADASAPSPITDYASYPAALPAGCPDGEAALVDVGFDNGRGGTASSLWGLDVAHGDTVTMTWTGWHPGCTTGGDPAVAVSLAAYDSPTTSFDPTVDQQLDSWTSCGADAGACTTSEGRFRLALTLPGSEDACNVQLDAVLGLPLGVVGPNGSFYSSGSRGSGPNMLLSANNFDLQPCVASTSTSTSAAPASTEAPAATTTSAPGGEETTTTTGDIGPATTESPTTSVTPTTLEGSATTTEPTLPPDTTAPPGSAAPSSVSAPALSTSPTPPAADEVLAAQVSRPGGTLPRTGSDTLTVVRFAAVLFLTGGVALATYGLVTRHRRPTA